MKQIKRIIHKINQKSCFFLKNKFNNIDKPLAIWQKQKMRRDNLTKLETKGCYYSADSHEIENITRDHNESLNSKKLETQKK